MTSQQIIQEGLEHHKAGRRAEAQSCYRQALLVDPANHVAMAMLGALLVEARDSVGAVELFSQAAKLAPAVAEYHNALGRALLNEHRVTQAVIAFGKALDLRPDYADACYNLGCACVQLGEADKAVNILIHAIKLRPAFAQAYSELAIALRECGQLDQSMTAAARAVQIDPKSAWGHNILGMVYADRGQAQEAFDSFARSLALRPDQPEPYLNLAHLRWRGGQLIDAIADLKHAAELAPRDARARHDLGVVFSDIGAQDEAVGSLRAALALRPDSPAAHSALLLTMNYHPDLAPREKFEEHLRWARQHATFPAAKFPERDRAPRRLRIGYVSADFYRHSVSWFIEPILAAHDQRKFEVFCYSDVLKPDSATERIRQLPITWRPITGAGPDAAAEMIRNDQIDILVDLGGHTQRNRMLLFSRKPAPVQVTYLGYPNTAGLSQMDYRFTDAVADPPGESDLLHTEKLIRLPHGFLCYQPPREIPRLSELPRAAREGITFASFNVLAKLTPPAIALWSRILTAVPRSRLILKNNSLADPKVRDLLAAAFAGHGVAADRLELRPPTATVAEHLSMYGHADIALDTFPYNGTTTTCEALWMGRPVITWTGDTHAARVGASILTQVGLPELIGGSPEDYFHLAVELANDPARLAEIRSNLRDRLTRSSLLNPAQITADIESAYEKMWITSPSL